jgi:hypothetical protein
MICAGDTFQVPYTVNYAAWYKTGNVFTAQLSNSSGTFTGGVTTIGTRTSNTSGSITCVVPNAVTAGNNYRIRIVSNNNPDSSEANPRNISVGVVRPVKPITANNGPICTSQTLNLTANSTTSGVTYTWIGPNSFSSTMQNPSVTSATTANSGAYIVTARLFGCLSKDTTNASVVSLSSFSVTANATTPICQNDTLKLTATVLPAANNYSWSGPYGFHSSSRDTNIINAQPAISGDYILTANYTVCTVNDTVTVLVKPLPSAVNNSNNGPLCTGATLLLTGSTTSSGVSWSWTGPNSFSSSLQNPNITSVTTAANGNYIAVATLNGCSVKDTTTVVVNPTPPALSVSANTPVCTGQDLKLNVSTLIGVTYTWSGPSGYSSSAQNPVRNSAVAGMAGVYTVTATANNCTSPQGSVMVNVLPAPDISVYPSPKDSICQGATVTLVSTASNAGTAPSYQWHKNNTFITGATSKNYSTATAVDYDAYYCIMNVTGVCYDPYKDTSNSITVRVFPWLVPSVNITASPSGTVSSGSMINFTAKPTNGGSVPQYQWKRNSANILGAIGNTWGAATLSNKDVICVDMTSAYLCPNPAKVTSNCITVSIESNGVETLNSNTIKIFPNPTNETLFIEGIEQQTQIQLTDVLGRIVYQTKSSADGGLITIPTKALVPGNYTLWLTDELHITTYKVLKE